MKKLLIASSPFVAIITMAVVSFSGANTALAVSIDWITVGNAGNAGDASALNEGAVAYEYRIGETEVTNDQYAEFLNSIAASDPNSVFDSNMDITRSGGDGSYSYTVNATFGANPVNYISFFRAMRFVNWLANGQSVGPQGAGTTEDGTYLISNGTSENRAPGASFFLPSEDEWFKAAYHKNDGVTGNYWDFPTQSNYGSTTIAEPPPAVPTAGTSLVLWATPRT